MCDKMEADEWDEKAGKWVRFFSLAHKGLFLFHFIFSFRFAKFYILILADVTTILYTGLVEEFISMNLHSKEIEIRPSLFTSRRSRTRCLHLKLLASWPSEENITLALTTRRIKVFFFTLAPASLLMPYPMSRTRFDILDPRRSNFTIEWQFLFNRS